MFFYLKCIALYKQLNNTTPSFKEPNLVGIIYVKIIKNLPYFDSLAHIIKNHRFCMLNNKIGVLVTGCVTGCNLCYLT